MPSNPSDNTEPATYAKLGEFANAIEDFLTILKREDREAERGKSFHNLRTTLADVSRALRKTLKGKARQDVISAEDAAQLAPSMLKLVDEVVNHPVIIHSVHNEIFEDPQTYRVLKFGSDGNSLLEQAYVNLEHHFNEMFEGISTKNLDFNISVEKIIGNKQILQFIPNISQRMN